MVWGEQVSTHQNRKQFRHHLLKCREVPNRQLKERADLMKRLSYPSVQRLLQASRTHETFPRPVAAITSRSRVQRNRQKRSARWPSFVDFRPRRRHASSSNSRKIARGEMCSSRHQPRTTLTVRTTRVSKNQ